MKESFFNPSDYRDIKDMPEAEQEDFNGLSGHGVFVRQSAVNEVAQAQEDARALNDARSTIQKQFSKGQSPLDVLQEQANAMNRAYDSGEQIPKQSERNEAYVVDATLEFGGGFGQAISARMEIDPNGKVLEFTKDLENEYLPSYYTKEEIEQMIKPLVDAGVKVDYQAGKSDGESNADWEGGIWIKKDDVNRAMHDGLISFHLVRNEHGDGNSLVFETVPQ